MTNTSSTALLLDTKISLRLAASKDFPYVMALGRALHGESRYRDMPFSERTVQKNFFAAVNNDSLYAAVAERHGEIIGIIAGMCTDHYFTLEKIACDFLFYVSPDQRGTVAGFMLIRSFEAWAKRMDCFEVQLGVTTGIHPERTGMYLQRLGFTGSGQLYTKKC